MSSFDDALKVWAKRYLEKEYSWKNIQIAEVLRASVDYREANGYCETCYEDESICIDITYKTPTGEMVEVWEYDYDRVWISQFQLLQELFKED